VEAVILVPVIMLSITIVIYLGLILCQRCSIQSDADHLSEAGSAGWRYSASEIQTGKLHLSDFGKDGLYWRIFDTNKEHKIKKVTDAAKDTSDPEVLKKGFEGSFSAVLTDFIAIKRLNVQIEQEFMVPMPGFFKIFGLGNKLKISAKSVSTVNDPVELIRSTDFAIDLKHELEQKYPSIGNISEKAENVLKQVKDKISDMFN
jgi:hypothetical protein